MMWWRERQRVLICPSLRIPNVHVDEHDRGMVAASWGARRLTSIAGTGTAGKANSVSFSRAAR
jgi:hypothetical protein